jgi:hypothetical protein
MKHKISGAEEIINRIADKISEMVDELGQGQKCETCKKAFKNYNGNCRGYFWDLYYGPQGFWEFTLKLHKKEIWHRRVEGSISDVLLEAIKGLSGGEWKSKH